jgi:LPXTG-site transpeptidase (sortase) family protein
MSTNDDNVQKHTSSSSNDDLLAELREKTARLAAQVRGHDEPQQKTLKLDEKPVEDEVVIESLKVPEAAAFKPEKRPESSNPAVELIRTKLDKLYGKEPDASAEAAEAEYSHHRSKHQQFMHELTTSGKSLADIQTEWHHYYVSLPDDEKHQVWHEFYENQAAVSKYEQAKQSTKPKKHTKHVKDKILKATTLQSTHAASEDMRSVTDIKSQLMSKINAGGTLKPIHHFKSLLFGLGLASLVGLIMTFTFFNEVFIAPFISPARAVSTTPIIGNVTGEVGPEPKIIIPKINLEVPVVFGMSSVSEDAVQLALEDGVVHYANTPNPGEQGNSVIVGHSSNNILNSGKYKFAFVLLKRLEPEDTFFVNKDGVRYTYKVYRKEVVGPNDVSVLDTQDRPNTMTLITCDPPGTSINRLIIVAEQISPDPAGNKASTAITNDSDPAVLPSNAPSLWSRLWPF